MDASIRSRSALITVAIHVALILILIFSFMRTQIPPFPEANGGGGVLISIGTLAEASGDIQPMSENVSVSPAPVVSKNTPQEEEEYATQETEEAPVVKVNKDKKKETVVAKAEPKVTPVKPAEPKKADPNALYPGKNTSKSQGTGQGAGDQGERNGDPFAKYTGKSGTGTAGSGGGSGNSDGPGSGSGAPGTGISFSLAGRNLVKKPSISDNSQETGKVVVDITVDKDGNVAYANPGVKGTTTSSTLLFKLAKDAALRAKFSPSDNGADIQRGTITFVFVVQ